MRLLTTISALRSYIALARASTQEENQSSVRELFSEETSSLIQSDIGLVPTMGALHQGHLSLIERARTENFIVIVSIFVNPLQFGVNEDFEQYPRNLEQDMISCQRAGVDAIFAPAPEQMGILLKNKQESKFTQVIPPSAMISGLCGHSRLGHFEGVATIVTKLFNLVKPDRAYFGQKDGQQLAIIKKLVADLDIPVEIVACPIVREASGLALSSRNQYLSAQQKQEASVLYRSLQAAQKAFRAGERRCRELTTLAEQELRKVSNLSVEYIELVEPTTLMPIEQIKEEGMLAIASRIGSTRLIDNVILRDRKPIIAIDGPAGAGKSTVARQVAAKLGLIYLDTGAMYRSVTWLVMEKGVAIDDECAVAELVDNYEVELTPCGDLNTPVRVWIGGKDVTHVIRTPKVTSNVSAIAAQTSVRRALVNQQQKWGIKGGLVAEGRDIGTHVFPDAEVKIYLTASVAERARRRQQDFQKQGLSEINLEQIQKDIAERDSKDSTRKVSPLRQAKDAIELRSDGLDISDVAEKIVSQYQHYLSMR